MEKLKKDFRLVLASRSPRRRLLLEEQGYKFDIIPSDDKKEEELAQSLSRLTPKEFVKTLATFKAENVARQIQRQKLDGCYCSDLLTKQTIVLACDSVAVCHNIILGKPQDEFDAKRMLQCLSGSTHFVHTGLCLWNIERQKHISVVETSQLRMTPLSSRQLNDYLASGLWKGKAGAFGYQDDNDWLILESGSASNVVGLPLERLKIELEQFLDF
ncbi:MAG: Maf family protein [Planctomycetia bacterium]|nr:Maf family protein [Planctomycetia bacterium]